MLLVDRAAYDSRVLSFLLLPSTNSYKTIYLYQLILVSSLWLIQVFIPIEPLSWTLFSLLLSFRSLQQSSIYYNINWQTLSTGCCPPPGHGWLAADHRVSHPIILLCRNAPARWLNNSRCGLIIHNRCQFLCWLLVFQAIGIRFC